MSVNRLAAAALVLVLSTCSDRSAQVASPNAAELARAVSISTVQLRSMARSLAASGLLVSREEASVGTELSGFVVKDVLVEEGAVVNAGAVLAILDSELLAAKIAQAAARLAQADAHAKLAMSDAARVENVKDSNVFSKEHIENRLAQAEIAKAEWRAANAQLNELRTQEKRMRIRAPVSGLILERTVNPGDVANSAQVMFRMARDSLLELEAEIPEAGIGQLSLGQVATVSLPSGPELQGEVRLISPRIDPQTKLGRVRVSLPLDPALREGGFARVVFSREATPVPAVPEKAVQFEAGGPLLVIMDEHNRAKRVAIRTGVRADGFVAIVDGPDIGSRVVLGGGAFLLDGDLIDPMQNGELAADTYSEAAR